LREGGILMPNNFFYACTAIILLLSASMAIDSSLVTTEPSSRESYQEGLTLLFDQPEQTAELPETFQKTQECAEIPLSQEQQEERVCISTQKFMAEKNRKSFEPGYTDTFAHILRRSDIPVTYLTGLSIDGGGTRGLIPALLLEELSRKLSKPLYHYFDYIGGTSIGGILTLGLAAPGAGENSHRPLLEINDLVQLFYQRGQDIFPSVRVGRSSSNFFMRLWDGLRYLVTMGSSMVISQYGAQRLEELLKEKFGEKAFLHEMLTNTLITAVDIGNDRSQTYLFDSRKAEKLHRNDEVSIPLWQVGRSTSAAPTYFPAYKLNIEDDQGRILNSHTLIDGGLWLNNPSSLVAKALLNFASEKALFASSQNIIMLSLGTGYAAISNQIPKNAGMLNAAVPVIDTLMNVSSFGTHESLQGILGKNNYKRINPQLQKEIKLDETNHAQLDILKEAAEEQYDKLDDFIDGYFRRALEEDQFHRAQGKGKEPLF